MAQRGFWAAQFRQGACEAVAANWRAREETHAEVQAWLEKTGPTELVKMTGGKYGLEDIGRAVSDGLELHDRAVRELEESTTPIAHDVLAGLYIQATLTRKVSYGLGNALAVEYGEVATRTKWWKENAKQVRSESLKLSSVRKVMGS